MDEVYNRDDLPERDDPSAGDDLTTQDEPADRNASRGPARPASLTVDFYENDEGVLIHKKRGNGPAIFLLLWLIGWTVACVALAVSAFRNPAIGTLTFAIPFWASWLFVAALLVWMWFGKETFLLRDDAALFQRTALVKLTSRIVPRAEIHEFRECESAHTENDKRLHGIEMVTTGKPLKFHFRLPDRERVWLIFRLNQSLSSTRDEAEPVARSQATVATAVTEQIRPFAADTASLAQTLTYDQTQAEPPTDSDWTLTDDIHFFTFSASGKFMFTAVGVLLFINAFWNGIVSTFVLVQFGLIPVKNNNMPQGWGWWGVTIFLIPFVGIGLVMFFALLFVVLEPFRRSTWRFEKDRVVCDVRWPIYGRSKAWPIADVDRLELHRGNSDDPSSKSPSKSLRDQSSSEQFALAFVSTSNVDICVIDELTEGEARWFARQILDRRPKWFVSRPS